ncbi:MAG: WD40 repeat domain-containing serine/threonine-protein kinase [Planctomycetota bacterium]
MDRDTYQRAQEALARVLEAPPEARAATLAAACGGDPELRARVEALLPHAGDEGAFSERSLDDRRQHLDRLMSGVERDALEEGAPWIPDAVGDYRVVRWIGRGGAGIVLEAEQRRPKRRVAIKVVHPAFASAETARRLAKEAEALGRLQHPGIAQVYEAGTFDGGLGPQPFIAMELIDGIDVVRHAHAAGLDLRARVALVADIADAVQHAHERGVVHRDLKPENVLIDRAGRPKLLDFGIAGLLVEGGGVVSLPTLDSQLLGTLAYMAPEQAQRGRARLDARVDVFALGALTFELVTGRRLRELGGLSVTSALRDVAEGEVPRARAIDPALPRDLETIIGKALEQRPERRYDSAAAFAADLRRLLEHRPILARSPSVLDRCLKYARRHRVLVGGASATILALSAGLTVAARAARDASRAREDARAQLYAAEMVLGTRALGAPDGNRRVEALAAHWRPARGAPDLRGWEWRLLDRAARHDAVRLAAGAYPMDAAWSPAGDVIAVATELGLALCDANSGRRLGGSDRLAPESGSILWTNAAFSPDGACVALAGVGAVVVWDVAAAAPAWMNSGAEVHAITWSADGLRLYALEEDLVVYDARSGARLGVLLEGVAGVGGVELEPRGSGLALSAALAPLCVVDVDTGEVRSTWTGNMEPQTAFRWSPDGARIAACGFDDTLRVFGASRGALALELVVDECQEPLLDLAWSRSGDRIAVAVEDSTVRIFDAQNGARREVFQAHRTQVRRVAWSPDGARIASVATHGEALVWPVGVPPVARRIPLAPLARGTFRGALSWSRDGDLLLCGGTAGRGVLMRRTGEVVRQLPGSYALSIAPSGRFYANVAEGHVVSVYGLEGAPPLATVAVGDDPWATCAWEPSGRRLAFGSRDGVFIAEVADEGPAGPLVFEKLADTDRQVQELAWSSDGRELAYVTMWADLRVIDASDGRTRVDTKPEGRVGAYGVAWSPDGSQLVTAGSDGALRMYARATGAQVARLDGHSSRVESVSWHPAGDRIASAGRDRTVKVWDPEARALVASFDCGSRLCAVRWSPDGTQLVALDVDGVVHLWDAGR